MSPPEDDLREQIKDTFPVGAIITDGGMGWPWIKTVGGNWFRQGSKRMTWGEVLAWHQSAIDDLDDETTGPFCPVLMLPAAATRMAALEEAAVIAESRHDVPVGGDTTGRVFMQSTARFPDDGRRIAAAIRSAKEVIP